MKRLGGLTEKEENDLQRYLHMIPQTAEEMDPHEWVDMVHELYSIKGRNTPAGRDIQFPILEPA